MKNKIIIKILILSALIFLTGVYYSCQSPVGPDLTPGRRDYKWTADTLIVFPDNVEINRIWGTSSNDIWAVGFSTSVRYRVWHYDGVQWKNYTVNGNVESNAIWGFSSNNIWMANWLGGLWYYDGTEWKLYNTYRIDGYQGMVFNCIYGDSPNNIYLVGSAMRNGNENLGVIMHYDGYAWTYVNIPAMDVQFGTIVKQNKSGTYLIVGININNGTVTSKLFSFDGRNIKEIYSTTKSIAVSSINGDAYVTIGLQIFRYNYDVLGSKGLVKWLTPPPDLVYGGGFLWGRSDKDFFFGSFKGLGHYNGTNFKILYPSNLRSTGGVFAVDNSIFASFYDDNSGSSVIVQGELIK